MRFTTPVSMIIPTKEQWNNDLKQQLIDLGYIIYKYNSDIVLLVTKNAESNERTCFYKEDSPSKTLENRYFIDHYNPELFLSLAAMTDQEIPIIGEWMYYNYKEALFQVNSYKSKNNYLKGHIDRSNPTGNGYYSKPTKEQLIEHFNKSSIKPLCSKIKEDPLDEYNRFPIEIEKRVMECQVEQGNEPDINVIYEFKGANAENRGFTWEDSKEGINFWHAVIRAKDYDTFFKKYPKKSNFKLEENISIKLRNKEEFDKITSILKELGYKTFSTKDKQFSKTYNCLNIYVNIKYFQMFDCKENKEVSYQNFISNYKSQETKVKEERKIKVESLTLEKKEEPTIIIKRPRVIKF